MRILATLLALTLVGCVGDESDENYACGDGDCHPMEQGICPDDCIICNDGFCDPVELERGSCPADCDVCGDGECTNHEFNYGCASDCYLCINLIWRVIVACIPENCGMQEDVICSHCGDGVCEWGEEDMGCPDCFDAVCGDGECLPWEWGRCEDCADEVCGDDFCGRWEEEFGLCTEDCDACGDGLCDSTEYNFCTIDCGPL